MSETTTTRMTAFEQLTVEMRLFDERRAETTTTPVTEEAPIKTDDIDEKSQDGPESKKIKLEKPAKNLEERLCDILVCTVCLDDSKTSIYQVILV